MKKLLIITQKVDENDQLLGFFIDWIDRFAQKFEKVTVICLEKGKFNLPNNIEVISLGKDNGLPKLFWLFNFYKYIFSKRNGYDAVFVHMNPIWVILGSGYWHLAGKKVYLWYAHKSVTLKLKLAVKFSDIIFTSTLDGFRLNSKKLKIMGQGINTDRFKPDEVTKPDAGKLISVGRIAPIKNYEPLIETLKIFKDEGTDIRLTIVGEPTLGADVSYEHKLKEMVRQMGLEDRVTFVGKIKNSDLPTYYRQHKVYINLSNTGSLDKTIVEAMASGCVVLSSNDSAKKFLPANMAIRSKDPNDLATQIKEALQLDIGPKLRDYVIKNHSLPELIASMSNLMKQSGVANTLIVGYPYIRENYLNTFNSYPGKSKVFFLLPKVWKVKGGKVVYFAPQRDNVFSVKAFFSHSHYPIIGGLLKGWMPGFLSFMLNNKESKNIGTVITLTEPSLLSTLYQAVVSKLCGTRHFLFTWENIAYDEKFSGFNLQFKKIVIGLNIFFSDGIICGNKKGVAIMSHYTNKPIVNIPFSGIDTEFLKPFVAEKVFREFDFKDKLLFTYVGALEFRKGVHLVIEAFVRVSKTISNTHLIIAGTGDTGYEKQLDDLIKKYDMGECVTRIPWLSHEELRTVFAITDVFVYPSISHKGWEEQLGYLLMEASSAGKAIISTISGSIDEVIVDRKTGLLVAPDDAESLAGAMLEFANDPVLRETLGNAARQHIINNFDYKIVARKFCDLLEK